MFVWQQRSGGRRHKINININIRIPKKSIAISIFKLFLVVEGIKVPWYNVYVPGSMKQEEGIGYVLVEVKLVAIQSFDECVKF